MKARFRLIAFAIAIAALPACSGQKMAPVKGRVMFDGKPVKTPGDLRRLMIASADVLSLTAGDVMKKEPRTIRREMLAVEALKIMETHKITSVVVATDEGQVDGVVHLHDLWRTQMI